MAARAILSLDAPKAFNGTEWDFLSGVLYKNLALVITSALMTHIQVNGLLPDLFPLHRGAQQGCLPSPLLFALALYPLATTIRQYSQIVGFCRQLGKEKIALYTDDNLLFLGVTTHSLVAGMSLITTYGCFSGSFINWDKYVLLHLDPVTEPLSAIASQIKSISLFKYLGVVVSFIIMEYIQLNLQPVLLTMEKK